MEVEGRWQDLETRGFVVVRNFLSADHLRLIDEDARSRVRHITDVTTMSLTSPESARLARERVAAAMPEIRQNAGISVTTFDPWVWFFATAPGACKARWHTDPTVYYFYQRGNEYINFWIPIRKPSKDSSGLSLVPMDTLRERDPAFYRALNEYGAANMIAKEIVDGGEDAIWNALHVDFANPETDRGVLVYEGEGRLEHVVPAVPIAELAVTPDVGPGDAVIARGDVLHRTQDAKSERVALSLRAVNGKQVIDRAALLKMSTYKKRRLLGRAESDGTSRLLAAFAFHDRTRITVDEFHEFYDAVEASRQPHVKLFEETRAALPKLLAGEETH